jgi:hypothetical protein
MKGLGNLEKTQNTCDLDLVSFSEGFFILKKVFKTPASRTREVSHRWP